MQVVSSGLKRGVVIVYDAVSAIVVSALLSLAFVTPAFAYVDPSVMTYTIQALAGVAVALSAVAGVAFRRTRKALFKALNIDEDAHKEVESDLHRVKDGVVLLESGEQAASEDGESVGAAGARAAKDAGFRMKWWQRLVVGAVVSAFTVLTLFVVAPYELVAGNSSSLLFSLPAVWAPVALSALVIAAVLAFGLSALRGRAFVIGAILVFCFGLGCYVQAMFMNAGLPVGDGHKVNWGSFMGITIVSLLVWIALFAIPLVLQHKFRRQTMAGVTALAAALIIVQGVGVASLFADQQGSVRDHVADNYIMTEEGMFTVSPKKNVIVFVLDTYDTVDLKGALESDPGMLDEMTGFTWFQDSVGSMDPTRYGAVFLHNGTYLQPGEDVTTFVAKRYERSNYIGDIHDAGYSIGLYTDTLGDYLMPEQVRREMLYDKTINIIFPGGDGLPLDTAPMLVELAKCALYRDLPWVAKAPFWFTTDEVNKAMALESEAGASTPYAMDDAAWYGKLRKQRLAFTNDDAEGAYRFIHLLGTHVPYELNEHGENIGMWNSDWMSQARGEMLIVSEYLRQLKELGAYDDATIIITADHGEWFDKDYRDDWDIPTSPIMLVKPSGAPNGPVTISKAQVTAYDILPTVIDAMTGDSGAYGKTVFEQPESGRDRRYMHTITFQNEDLEIIEYQITGDVLEESNWVKTGVTWDPSETPRS